jgi:hypothetical protein
VLLVGVGGIRAILVAGDRLVLDAVVGREIAAPEREQGRREAYERDCGLAARSAGTRRARAGCADRLAGERRGAHRAERLHVLHREPSLRQRALHERDHSHRLRQFHHAANTGHALGGARAQVGLAAGRDLQLAVLRAHCGGPVGRPMHE